MKPILPLIFVTALTLISLDRARAQKGTATGAASSAQANYVFDDFAAFPPSAPDYIEISEATSTQLTLWWEESIPGLPSRHIDHYEILRNGQPVLQTQDTEATVAYDPNGPVFEFFSVRAVDDKGISSGETDELDAPRMAGAESCRQDFVSFGADAQKLGIGNPINDRSYRSVTYSHNLRTDIFDNDQQEHFISFISDTLTITRTLNDNTGFVKTAVEGAIQGPNGSADWIADELFYPPRARNPLDGYVLFPDASIGTIPQELSLRFSGDGTRASSDVDWSELRNGTWQHHTGTVSLSYTDEYTEADLAAAAEAAYEAAKSATLGSSWPRSDPNIYAAENIEWSANTRYASRFLSGTAYRFTAGDFEPAHIRWMEIFWPEDGSPPELLAVRDVILAPNEESAVFVVDAPSIPGGVTLSMVGTGMTLDKFSPESGGDLYLVDGLWMNQASYLDVPIDAGLPLDASITVSGDADTVHLLAVDPAVVYFDGLAAAIAAGQPLSSGSDLKSVYDSGKELLVYGEGAGQLQVEVRLSYQGNGVMSFSKTITVLPIMSLAIDANRDGQIKFASEDNSDATSPGQPLRFWVNDDDDEWVTTTALGVVETEREQDDKNITDVSKQNWRGNVIPCERDLEDFARIQVSLSGLTDAVKNGQLYLGLKWKNTTGTPAIKLYRATDSNGTTGYLTTPSAATRQALEVAIIDARYPGYSPDGQFVSDHTLIEGTDVFVIPSLQFVNLSESNPRTNFQFEGCKAGTGQLALVILKKESDGSFTTVGDGPGVWMDLKEPNQFIQRWTCGDGDRGAVSTVALDPSKSGTFGAPTTDEEKDMVLYVHGYNMQEFEKQRWIETTYKRLWHLGYKGRVGGFTWPCAQSSVPFDQSEEKAWQAGAQLLALLNTLKSQGYRVHLLGHSLGNVIIGEALRQAGPNSAVAMTYIASQAAIPAHCYDAAQPDRSGATAFTPDTPNIYSRFRMANEDPYLPANWSASDPSYLVQMQLQGSVGKFVNFFNPQDYALSGNGFSLLSDDGTQPGWLADQRLKPDFGWGYNSTGGFVQITGAAESPSVTRLTVALPAERYQIFAYCAEARSLALGASANMGGVFSGSEVNLTDDPFNFRNQHIYHSGQFRGFYAQRWQYWRRFLLECNLHPRETP